MVIDLRKKTSKKKQLPVRQDDLRMKITVQLLISMIIEIYRKAFSKNNN